MFLNSPNDDTLYFKHTVSHQRNRKHLKKEPTTFDMVKALLTKYGGKNPTIPDLKFLLTCLLGLDSHDFNVSRNYLTLR